MPYTNPKILSLFFFFLCGHRGPPIGENAVGISFRKMIGTIIKKVLCTLYTKSSLSLNRLISIYAVFVERILFCKKN